MKISQAYTILSDIGQRKEYNKYGSLGLYCSVLYIADCSVLYIADCSVLYIAEKPS